MENLSINQWAMEDRPREKMMTKGVEALSDAELLAILIGSGSTGESAVSLMQRVLARCGNNLNTLAKWELQDYTSFKGLGPAKGIKVMAALELGKRRASQSPTDRPVIKESTDIYRIFHPLLCDLPHEEFWLLMMNQAAKVIGKVRISQGGIDQTAVDVRTIMREAILHQATQIALAHNHPSGNVMPSQADMFLTNNIRKASDIMNIRLTDHVIVTDGHYFSFHDQALI
ncbi:MAG: DNA repair protein RadC [Bacteroidaceae bacterium]|nr:DNA repair protein RadC [Bacteroidaceae bacterium]